MTVAVRVLLGLVPAVVLVLTLVWALQRRLIYQPDVAPVPAAAVVLPGGEAVAGLMVDYRATAAIPVAPGPILFSETASAARWWPSSPEHPPAGLLLCDRFPAPTTTTRSCWTGRNWSRP